MSIGKYIDNYSFQVSEQETIFRDLFGRDELEQTRIEFFTYHSKECTWLEYMKQEIERKLKEQDGDNKEL